MKKPAVTIFDPIEIKGLTIPNRIVLPPLVRFSVLGTEGFANDRLVNWYRSVAKSGVGLIIVEATSVSIGGKLRDHQLGIWDDKFIEGLKQIADAVHETSSKVMIQLHHAGFKEKIKSISKDRLDTILDDFKAAFIRAKKASFDGIEVHGAHAYLLSQLASPLWNLRTDEYGGDFSRRMYFVDRLIKGTRALFDDHFILGYRLGGNEPHLEQGIAIAQYLESIGVDLLHVSSGIPDPSFKREEKINCPEDFPLDWVVYMATEIKKHVHIPVIAVKRIRKESQASWLVENGLADMTAIGRAMLDHPQWMRKARRDFDRRKAEGQGVELPLSTQSPGFDIFCKVIDNYGDIGVVLRLAKELRRTLPGETSIRVIVNSLKELKVLCPAIKERRPMQQWGGLTFIREDFFLANFRNPGPAPLILQTFGCELPEEYLEVAREKSKLLVNIEYLTGEKWAEGCHLKESPGPGTLRKYFYFPGFTPESGGILSRPHLSERIRKNPEKYRFKYFGSFGAGEDALRGTVFSYERDFSNFFEALRLLDRPVLLLVIGEKAGNSVRKNLSFFHKKDFGNIYKCGKIELKCVDFFNQDMYEELVDAADFNLARGEDSAAIAAASGKPYLWELYPQEGNAQMEKLEGFLRVYGKFWDRESPQWEKTAALFREYNDRSQGTQDPSVESWLHYFRNLDAIASVHEQFAAELTTRCNLLEKLKSFIQEYSGGKL